VSENFKNRIVGYGEEKPEQLLANPLNYRIHPKFQQDALVGILDEIGWVDDVIVNKITGHVLDGHLRVELAISRKEPSIPVKYIELTEAEEKEVLAVFDPLSALAGRDDEILKRLLEEVKTDNENVQKLLDSIAKDSGIIIGGGKEEMVDPSELIDKAEELQKKWQVHKGDLWQCGKHRILCGDSTNADDVERVMWGKKAGLMVTDPPYAVDYIAKAKDMNRRGYVHSRATLGAAIAGDELSEAQCSEIWLKAFTLARNIALSKHAAWYVWHAVRATRTFYDVLDSVGILYHQEIIWVKQNFVIGRSDYQWKHEPCFYGWVKGNRPPFYGDKAQTTVWMIDRDANNKPDHPTQKPIACLLPQMTNHLKVDGIAYDPFAGISPLLVACEQTGRIGRGIEIEPKYVAVSLERLRLLGLECNKTS